MADEIITPEIDEIQKYIEEIQRLKAESVSRREFDDVREENRKLLGALVKGTTIETDSTESAAKPTIEELRERAFGKAPKTDLEYVTAVLDLRDRLIEEEGVDHFIPHGKKYSPDYNDEFVANKVANGLRHCVEVANGDNDVFIQEVTRITADSGIPFRAGNKFK